MCAPVLEQRAAEHGGALKIVKLNVDENPQTPAALGIRGIPTLMLFKDGELAATQVGAAAKSQLAAFVAPHLAEIGREHVLTPVTNAQLVCRLLLEKKNKTIKRNCRKQQD